MRTYGDEPRPVTLKDGEVRYARQATSTDALWFTIYDVATWRAIGRTDLFRIEERHRSASFGMMIGEADYRGRGYGTETARLMLDYAFTALGLHSVRLDVDEFNLSGRRAYTKAGFREIGRNREATWLNGR